MTDARTPFLDRLLAVLRRFGPTTSTRVAEELWPESTGWRGGNPRKAQGLARVATRHLNRLRARGEAKPLYVTRGFERGKLVEGWSGFTGTLWRATRMTR